MQVVTLDFETYYSQTYSLSKLTTEEYIRSPDFETIGVSVKVDDAPAVWFSGTTKQTKAFLNQYDWDNALAVAHNAVFDMAILSWVYDIRPKRIADTLSMARALGHDSVSLANLVKQYKLGEKGNEVVNALGMRRLDFDEDALCRYGAYCKNDTELAYKLFKVLVADFPLAELKLVDLTIRMFSEPVLELHEGALTAHLDCVQYDKEALLRTVAVDKDALMSNPKFAEVLRIYGVVPPMKISPITGKETLAFGKSDEDFKALLEHEDLGVQTLMAARLGVKSTLEETRTERFIGIAKRGKLPIPLRYYAAHTGRWGGDDKVNMQNLPRTSPLKYAMLAPEGHVMIDSDSSQIEARTLAWLAGQNDLVEAFEQGEDVYKIMAAKIYNKPEADITKDERVVGKVVILSSGYGVGWRKLQSFLKAQGTTVTDDEAQHIINTYRTSYPAIPKLWRKAGGVLDIILEDQTEKFGRDDLLVVEGAKGILLPNGLYLRYPNLRTITNEEGKTEYVYDTKKGKTVVPNRIYGGKVVENCIAEGTLVLTDSGWKPIEQIQPTDLVHDGVDFVSHGGKITKSVQACMSVDGVWMTEDHEVLTNEGWKTASQNPRPYRPQIRMADGACSGVQQRREEVLALSVPLRQASGEGRHGGEEGSKARRDAQLRVLNQTTNIQGQHYPRHEQAPSVCGVALHERQVSPIYAPSVGELWRAGYKGLQTVAKEIRKLLGGPRAYVQTGVGLKPERQRRELHPQELRMDDTAQELHEQEEHRAAGGRGGIVQEDRNTTQHDILPASPWVAAVGVNPETRPQKPVYDIMDCGPRHRFVVLGESGPFIVHNCCQALARIIIGEQMLLISKKYKVAMTVHDAIGCVVPKHEAGTGQEFIELCMRIRPSWAPDLPLNCEAGSGRSYGEC